METEDEIQYEYKNTIYTIVGSDELHQQLQSDSKLFAEYVEGHASSLETKDVATLETQDQKYFQDEDYVVWTSKTTFLLLDEVEKVKLDLRNPKVKKRNLWRRILYRMCLKGVQNMTEDTIERKFRNMKATFKNIKENKKQTSTGRGDIKWKYYDKMERIFAEERTISTEYAATPADICYQDGDSFVWTSKKIFLLLGEVEKVKLDLRNPKIKKRAVWRRIKNNMCLKGVQNITEDFIERKFRNMKATFKNIKENTTGKRDIKWKYYDAMEKIFAGDMTINIDGDPLGVSVFNDGDSAVWTPKKTVRCTQSPTSSGGSESPTPSDSKKTARCTKSPTPSGDSESPTPNVWQYTPSRQTRKQKAERSKQLYGLRKRQLDVEESRLQELALLRKAIEENNKMQAERNMLLKEFIKKTKIGNL